MNCTKDQLKAGIQAFINDDIIPHIQDKPLKMALFAVTQFPDLMDQFLCKAPVKVFLHESDGSYDLGSLQQAIEATMDRFGSFPITIQPVPFLIPSTITISLNREDLAKLIGSIERMR